jgi:hypothetical protein
MMRNEFMWPRKEKSWSLLKAVTATGYSGLKPNTGSRQEDRQTDRQTNRQTDKQTDRQIYQKREI